jgi:hypothetical protein
VPRSPRRRWAVFTLLDALDYVLLLAEVRPSALQTEKVPGLGALRAPSLTVTRAFWPALPIGAWRASKPNIEVTVEA